MWLPNALSVCVPYEIFWNLSPNKLKPFAKANEMKIKQKNCEMWMQGFYMMSAIGACFSKSSKYPNKPINFYSKKSKEEIEIQEWERFKCQFVGKYETEPGHVE